MVSRYYSPVVAPYGWEMIGRERFGADLCCTGPLLLGSSVCDRHIRVYWLESKMADNGHIYYAITNVGPISSPFFRIF